MSFWTWLRSPANRRGQIMDLLVFLANLLVLGRFTNLLQRLGHGFANRAHARAIGRTHSTWVNRAANQRLTEC